MLPPPPCSPLFPYTTLFRSFLSPLRRAGAGAVPSRRPRGGHPRGISIDASRDGPPQASSFAPALDRKSTRLNSSHVAISYAVFCLKKKKIKTENSYVTVCIT